MKAVSNHTGLPLHTAVLAMAFILTAVAGPQRTFSPHMLGPVPLPGGLVLSGLTQRVRKLLGMLLLPIETETKPNLEAAKRLDPEALRRMLSDRGGSGFNRERTSEIIQEFYGEQRIQCRLTSPHPINRIERLIRPVLIIRNPSPDTFDDLLNQSLEGSPLVVDDGRLVEELTRKRPRKAWLDLASKIARGATGQTAAYKLPLKIESMGRVDQRRLTPIVTCEDASGLFESTHPEVWELLNACSVIPAQASDVRPQSKKMEAWYRDYSKAVRRIIDDRVNEVRDHIDLAPEQARMILEAEVELRDSPAALFPRLLLMGMVLHYDAQLKGIVENAIRFANELADIMQLPKRVDLGFEAHKAKLLEKIRKHEPCNWSTVARHFNQQRRDCHEKALQALIEDGSITTDDQGRFRTVAAA